MEEETKECFVLCSCGEKHRVLAGKTAPHYWCRDNKIELKKGDEIEVSP